MRRMRLFVGFVVMAMIGTFAIAGLAGAADRAPTVIKIRGDNGDFHGRITSTRGACLGHRTVKVFKQRGDRQNPKRDKVIGTDTSERRNDVGIWSIGNSGFKRGDFYAKAKRTDACKLAFSKTISL
ncbi:MAG: hypothetical protein ACJ75I_01700 [Solirubrobacterales bacterium]